MWFSIESRNTPTHISDIHIYDPSTAPGGKVTRQDILDHIEQRLDKLFMREKRLPVPFGLGYSHWIEDPAFDLDYHVRFTSLGQPGDWRAFCEKVAAIIEEPLDMSRPLWEIHVIEGVDHVEGYPEGCFAIVHKKHHGQFDGASATYLKSVLHTLDPIPETKSVPSKQTETPDRVPSPFELIYKAYWNNLTAMPANRLSFLMRTLPSVPKAMNAMLKESQQPRTPRTRFSGTIPSPRRVLESRTFPMKDIQAFRKSCAGATVNDVVITIFSQALRKYLLHHNELPKESLKAEIPVSVRKEEEIAIGGNKLFNMITAVHSEIEDPIECMTKVHEATQYSKDITDSLGARDMVEMLDLAPLWAINGSIKMAMGMKISDLIPGLFSGFCMSNIPGSKVPLYFAGAKQLRMFNWGFLMDGMGLALNAGSYCDDLIFTVLSCPEMMPDVDFFAECLQEAFDGLSKAYQARACPTPGPEPVAVQTPESAEASASEPAVDTTDERAQVTGW